MIGTTSRYAGLTILVLEGSDGRGIPYISRRFLPPSGSIPLLGQIIVAQGDRLDLISSRTVGDPEQSWRICDANLAMNPVQLTSLPGRRLVVPLPSPEQGWNLIPGFDGQVQSAMRAALGQGIS